MSEPTCPHGYTTADLDTLLGDRRDAFSKWMYGQTQMICDGRRYNYATREYDADCPVPHGVVTYRWDVDRFLRGLPVTD